jgi:hypothetical protein
MGEIAEGASQREGEGGSREKRKSARKKRGRKKKKKTWVGIAGFCRFISNLLCVSFPYPVLAPLLAS